MYVTITFEVDTCIADPEVQEEVFRDEVQAALRSKGVEAEMLPREDTHD